jgi:cytochrome c oxidase subunit III
MDLGVGTLEPAESDPFTRKRRPGSTLSGGRPSGGSGGRGGGGGGDDSGQPRGKKFEDRPDSTPRDKSRILTGFLLLVVLMTFGGLMGAYVVVATNRALEWRPFDLPLQIWFSTIVILASSVSYEFGRGAITSGNIRGTRRWMVATTVLGAVFIASQLLVWLILVNNGLYMRGNPYAGFFYILTAIHAIHVIGGIIALGAVLLRSWHSARSDTEQTYRTDLSRSVGWYWHFMGGLWIVLFILLGFWK